jgi:thioredoxin-related protein
LIRVLIGCIFLLVNLSANYEEGKAVFEKKCSSCHGGFIEINILKENFFEKKNKLLNLKAPTENMLAYAIMDSPKKIGDPNDLEMRQIEIEEFLKSYLDEPERYKSICDEHILKFYETKPSMKGQLSDEEYVNLSYYFMEYKDNREKIKEEKILASDFDEKAITKKAKLEDKIIMVYATSKTCYFCKKMDKEVLSLEDVKSKMNEDYIFVKVDVDNEQLPFDLKKVYKEITPTFFILDKDGKYIKQYPGSWTKSDFLEILKENLK